MMISKRAMFVMGAMAAGATVAMLMPQLRGAQRRTIESSRIDEASEDSFPASDPPSFSAPAVAVPGPTS